MIKVNRRWLGFIFVMVVLVCDAGYTVSDLFYIPNFDQGIGNRVMELHVRTSMPCDFVDFNPDAPWTKVECVSLPNAIKAVVGDENGFSVVSDGSKWNSYRWLHAAPDAMAAGHGYDILGNYATFLLYNSFIRAEKKVYSSLRKRDVVITETDSSFVCDISGKWRGKTLFGLALCSKFPTDRIRMQNIMSKNKNLLLSFKLWVVRADGDSILLVRTGKMRYNVKELYDASFTLPDGTELRDYFGGVRTMPTMTKERRDFLCRETALEAARRILGALVAGDSIELREAMYTYDIPMHIRMHKGARVVKIKKVRSHCADSIFVYRLRWPAGVEKKGQLLRRRICLRRDSRYGLWRVNGGL